jgi:hypothetical protein
MLRKWLLLLHLLLLLCCYGSVTKEDDDKEEGTCDGKGDCSFRPAKDDAGANLVDYLIVGAGGSGIQTALFLKKYGYSFKILEREQSAGSFWTKFPVFQELISVNKRVQNSTQRFRYDWHSMLETPIEMWDVSKDYFPTGHEWHQYMNRVVEDAGMNIEYGVEVKNLATDDTPCVVLMDDSTLCAKFRVFVGTGLREKDERFLRAIGGIPYSDMTKEKAVGKRVCILGNGNAGMEVAQNVFSVADRVIVSGKHPTRLSAVTKYTGDVRVKFLNPLENFHGKLLDTIVHVDVPYAAYQGLDKALYRSQKEEVVKIMNGFSVANIHKCEVLVLATGFQSQVPGKQLKTRRFPSSDDWYATKENPSIHYVGWLMHQRDFRRGAGGFLSGFRYLIRNLIHHIREEDHGIQYPFHTFTKKEALEHSVNRFQTADDLVILQDGVILRDAILPVNNDDVQSETVEYHYYESVTYEFHKDFQHQEDIIYLYFGWGDGRSASSVFDNVYLFNDTMKLRNIFLHPVVEVNGMVREAEEDLDMIW